MGEILLSHAAAYLYRLGRGGKSETGNELHASQYAQRIFREMRRNMPENPRLKVFASIPRIEHFAGQGICVNGIHREVAARARLLQRQRGIVLHLERPVPEAELRLATRQRDVDVVSLQLEDAEGSADKIELELCREDVSQSIRRKPVHLDVEVLWRMRAAKNRIAHAPADEKRPSTGGLREPRNFSYRVIHVS